MVGNTIKKVILSAVERAGYVVYKTSANRSREEHVARLKEHVVRLETQKEKLLQAEHRARTAEFEAVRKLASADREFRLGRERDARELENARAETWAAQENARQLERQLDQLRQQRGELDGRVPETFNDTPPRRSGSPATPKEKSSTLEVPSD
jgi:chromosome segregation ATPase